MQYWEPPHLIPNCVIVENGIPIRADCRFSRAAAMAQVSLLFSRLTLLRLRQVVEQHLHWHSQFPSVPRAEGTFFETPRTVSPAKIFLLVIEATSIQHA